MTTKKVKILGKEFTIQEKELVAPKIFEIKAVGKRPFCTPFVKVICGVISCCCITMIVGLALIPVFLSLLKPSACNANTCLHNGTCASGVNGSSFSCSCSNGWYGDTCETYNSCWNNDCLNNATCVRHYSDTSFDCTCQNGYYGNKCKKYNSCWNSPCEGCVPTYDDSFEYACTCSKFTVNSVDCKSEIAQPLGVSLSMIRLSDGRVASSFDDNSIKIAKNFNFNGSNLTTQVLLGHTDFVNIITELNNDTLASGSCDKTIKIWDLSTSQNISTLAGHTDCVTSLTNVKTDYGDLLISGSNDKSILVWNRTNIIPFRNLTGHTNWIQSLAYTKQYPSFVSCSLDKNIKIWDLNSFDSKTEQIVQEALSGISALVFYNNALFSGDQNGRIAKYGAKTVEAHSKKISALEALNQNIFSASSFENDIIKWDLDLINKETLKGHSSGVNALTSSGGVLISGSKNGEIIYWYTGEKKTYPLAHNTSITLLKAFSTLLFSVSDDLVVKIWEISTQKIDFKTILSHKMDKVNALAVLNNALIIASDTEMNLWDLNTFKIVQSVPRLNSPIKVLSVFNADSLISGSSDGVIQIWNTKSLFSTYFLKQNDSLSTLTVKDNVVYTATNNQTVTKLTLTKKYLTIDFGMDLKNGHTDAVLTISFFFGKYLLSGSADTTIKMWDFNTRTLLQTLTGHSEDVTCLTPLEGGLFASGSQDKQIIIWDSFYVNLYQLKNHEGRIYSIVNYNKTLMLTSSADTSIILWQTTTTLTNKFTLKGHVRQIEDVTVLKNGNIVSASDDFTLKIWDNATNYKNLANLTAHSNDVYGLTTLQNGDFASCSKDRSIIIWSGTNYSVIDILYGHLRSVISLTTLSSNYFASGSCDRNVIIWEIGTLGKYEQKYILENHTDCINALVELSGINNYLVSGSDDQTIKMWNASNKFDLISTIDNLNGAVISLASLKQALVAGINDSSINVYYLQNDKLILRTILRGHTDSILDLKFLLNGNLASCSKDKTIRVWDMNLFVCIFLNKDHDRSVLSLLVLDNGNLVSSSEDKSIRIVNTDLFYNISVIF